MLRAPVIAMALGCAATAAPSGEAGSSKPRDDDLVDVASLIEDAVIDMRYATDDNFMGKKLYPVARCKL
ncbi:MAG TPA: M15 family metallopeptidase, partial [Kofleriaceae bacterium]